MKQVYWFNEIGKDSIAEAGGKGANLGEMASAGFPVPPGFVVSAGAFYDFIEKNKLDAVIKHKLAGLDLEDTRALDEASEAIKKAIVEGEIPSDLRSEIVRAYNKLCGVEWIPSMNDEVLVAVRSSATAEDLPSIAADEPVLTRINGKTTYLTIESVWKEFENNARIEVVSLGENNKLEWNSAKMYRHHTKARLYKITTKTGRSITITPEHSLVVLNPDTLCIEPSSIYRISKHTRIPVVKTLPDKKAGCDSDENVFLDIEKTLEGTPLIIDEKGVRVKEGKWQIQKPFPKAIPLNKEFGYLLGVYAAEGSTYGNNCVDFSCESAKIADRVKAYFDEIGLASSKNPKNVRVFSRTLVEIIYKFFGRPLPEKGKGRSAKVKKVPQLVFNQPEGFIAEFIKGYFDGDGTVGNGEVYATTASKDLASGVSHLLAMVGIKTRLRGNKYYDVCVPQSEAELYYRKIGFTEEKHDRKMQEALEKYLQRKKHHDFKDNLPASRKISGLIKDAVTSGLKKVDVAVVACPCCTGDMRKNGSSSSKKQRYICTNCSKSFSEGTFEKIEKTVQTFTERNEKGQFTHETKPWNVENKAQKTFGVSHLAIMAEKLHSSELRQVAEAEVTWDAIDKIEEVDYEGYVYDFIVPGTQNFLAGFGGVITHNTASFAGQQATYLNISGSEDVVKAVRRCWASLYEARAIYYRKSQGFDNVKVGIAVVVQKMVQSECSGVMFTADPVTNNRGKIIIEAGFGLGEAIVSGMITPDHYVVEKNSLEITTKQFNRQESMIVRKGKKTEAVEVPEEIQENQKLGDPQISKLAEIGLQLEKHYNKPQDVEWAVEKGGLYVVQTRAITTLKDESLARPASQPDNTHTTPNAAQSEQPKKKDAEELSTVLLNGSPSSPGTASGKVKIILSVKECYKLNKGEILVAKMTSPDFVPAMKRAKAIITDEGGATCHAAIVSRELGIPCVVGTMHATTTLKDGQEVTVDAFTGTIYEGIAKESEKPQDSPTTTLAKPSFATGTKVYVNLAEPELADKAASRDVDGVGLLRAEFMIAGMGVHPKKFLAEGRKQEFIDGLARGLRKICAAFQPRPVIYRATDFKTNEYRNLEGGQDEPQEENPMIGFRGCFRYVKDPEVFKMELEAIKKVRNQYGLKNLHLMIPFVRTTHEFEACKSIVEDSGLRRGHDFKLGIMCEVPSTVILAEEFCLKGLDFMSIGSNDLTQLTLGVDRDNPIVAEDFDERNEAVMKSLEKVVKACHKHGVKVGICGQAPSVYPEFTEAIIRYGIDSVSVNPDVIETTRKIIASAEMRALLDNTRKK